MYSKIFGIELPIKYPVKTMTDDQTNPPIILYAKNLLYFISPTPASVGASVLMIGTKRAIKIVLFPCFSKNFFVLSTYSLRKKNDSSFIKIFGPIFLPSQYPKLSPYTAKINEPSHKTQIFIYPCEASIPAVISNESPGRKKPKKSPVSAKIIKKRP